MPAHDGAPLGHGGAQVGVARRRDHQIRIEDEVEPRGGLEQLAEVGFRQPSAWCRTTRTKSSVSTGLATKATAPALRASSSISSSVWPVNTITGTCDSARSDFRASSTDHPS